MDDFNEQFGKPTGKAEHATEHFSKGDEVLIAAKELINNFNWYKGENDLK